MSTDGSWLQYKRLDHFRGWLEQACRPHEPPSKELVNRIQSFLDEQDLEYSICSIKNALRELRLNQQYENTQSISNILNDKPQIIISENVQNNLENKFSQVCKCYAEAAYPRKSFLSYVFITRKLLELAKQDREDEHIINQLLEVVPLHISGIKLEQNMKIWHNICQKLDWNCIPAQT